MRNTNNNNKEQNKAKHIDIRIKKPKGDPEKKRYQGVAYSQPKESAEG